LSSHESPRQTFYVQDSYTKPGELNQYDNMRVRELASESQTGHTKSVNEVPPPQFEDLKEEIISTT